MENKLIISIGSWVTLQAEGALAIEAALLVSAYVGALWFTAWWVTYRNKNSGS
jgi:hypothetical protein